MVCCSSSAICRRSAWARWLSRLPGDKHKPPKIYFSNTSHTLPVFPQNENSNPPHSHDILESRAGLSLVGPLPPTYLELPRLPWVKVTDKVQQLIRSCGPPPGLLIRCAWGPPRKLGRIRAALSMC